MGSTTKGFKKGANRSSFVQVVLFASAAALTPTISVFTNPKVYFSEQVNKTTRQTSDSPVWNPSLILTYMSAFQSIIATAVLTIAWALQLYVVFPLEQWFRVNSESLEAFSLLFLPHGAKVLVAIFLMQWSLPAIFLVSFAFGLKFGHPVDYAFYGALIAALTAILPIWLINLAVGESINNRIFIYAPARLSLFRMAMLISIGVAFANSALQSLLAKTMLKISHGPILNLGFLVGDIAGGIVCIVFSVLGVKYVLKALNYEN